MGILGELWVKLGLKSERFKKGVDDAKKQINGFAKYMSKLGGVMAGVFSITKIIQFTHQTAELANKTAGVKKAFDRLNSPGLLANLRKATMGTVDDLQLMQRAVQAKNFKIPLNQLATYLEFATKRANETGQSVDYLVDSIITGLGRQSLMILDNLGISAAEIRDNMKDGATMAEAVGKIIKEQMGEGATEIDKAALATARLQAAWTNLQMAIGDETKGPWNWLKDKAATLIENATSFIANAPAWKKWVSALFPIVGTGFIFSGKEATPGSTTSETQGGNVPAEGVKNETNAVAGLIGKLEEEIKKKEEIRDLSANEEEIRQLNDEIAAMKERLKILQMTSKEYAEYQANLDKSLKPIMIEGIFDKAKIEANTNAGLEALKKAKEKFLAEGANLSSAAVEWQEKIDDIVENFNTAIGTGISGGLQELARAIMGVEDADLGTVVQALLAPMADALISAGEMIVAQGLAVEAFKTSLKSLQGAPAIAAGAALVAVASAVKAGLQAIGNNPTAAGGYGNGAVTSYSGGYGVNTSNYAQQSQNYTLSTTLKGQDLLLAIERTQNSNRR